MHQNSTHFICVPVGILATILALLAPMPSVQAQQRATGLQLTESVNKLPEKIKRFALVIGVDQYVDTQITSLSGASNDAKALADALTRYAGFPSDQVILLASDQPNERQPTKGNILRRLSNFRSVVPKDGLLLVSFAGHGMERAGQAFLLPSDSQVSNDIDLLEDTAINVTQIKERIRKTGVGQVMLILDACRNDPMAGRSNTDNPLTESYVRGFDFDVRNREVRAFVTLYATAVGSRAYEYKERKQGYFTWAMTEGLKGGAANIKGEVTLAGLIRYLQERVPKQVALDLGTGKEQRPFAIVEGYRADELIIAIGKPSIQAEQNITAAEMTQFVKLLGPVLNDLAISKPAPDYPPEAKSAGTLGVVVLRVLIDEEGRVKSAKAVAGPFVFLEVAEKAAYKARFRQTTLGGMPVKVNGLLTYEFVPDK